MFESVLSFSYSHTLNMTKTSVSQNDIEKILIEKESVEKFTDTLYSREENLDIPQLLEFCNDENTDKNKDEKSNKIKKLFSNNSTIFSFIIKLEISLSIEEMSVSLNLIEHEFNFGIAYTEYRLLSKSNNKKLLNKLWKESIFDLLFEQSDSSVDEKFSKQFNNLKNEFFISSSCNERDKMEDFLEWCKDKDVLNITKFMKSLSKQIKMKNEAEMKLKNILEERRKIEKQYLENHNIDSEEFKNICQRIKENIIHNNNLNNFQ